MSILESIYQSEYSPEKALDKMPCSLRLRERAFFDAIEEAMGVEFIERHWDSLCKLEQFRGYANFREGFRLGVALMLEAAHP